MPLRRLVFFHYVGHGGQVHFSWITLYSGFVRGSAQNPLNTLRLWFTRVDITPHIHSLWLVVLHQLGTAPVFLSEEKEHCFRGWFGTHIL